MTQRSPSIGRGESRGRGHTAFRCTTHQPSVSSRFQQKPTMFTSSRDIDSLPKGESRVGEEGVCVCGGGDCGGGGSVG